MDDSRVLFKQSILLIVHRKRRYQVNNFKAKRLYIYIILVYCTVKRINGSNESVVLCVYFVYLSCVIVYKMLFTGLANGRCKRFYDGELPLPTCDDGVSSSVEVMVATGDFLLRWSYL